jgi:cytochrome c-type biogenesis protein CcmE
MDRKRFKFLLLGTGILLSMGFLMVVGMSRPGGFAYYMTVSEFLADPERGADGLRINGKVVTGSIERHSSGQEVDFLVSDGAAELPVRYAGVIPDTFVDDSDVVVEGKLDESGTFQAHTLLAKCPSKYEAADGYEGEGGYEAPSAPAAEVPSGT